MVKISRQSLSLQTRSSTSTPPSCCPSPGSFPSLLVLSAAAVPEVAEAVAEAVEAADSVAEVVVAEEAVAVVASEAAEEAVEAVASEAEAAEAVATEVAAEAGEAADSEDEAVAVTTDSFLIFSLSFFALKRKYFFCCFTFKDVREKLCCQFSRDIT